VRAAAKATVGKSQAPSVLQADSYRFAFREGVRRLYKFRGYVGEARNWVRDTIERSTIYFSSPPQLNDPFDMQPFHQISGDPRANATLQQIKRDSRRLMKERKIPLERQIRELKALDGADLAAMARVATERTRATLDTAYGVYSLAADGSHPLLWSHYADSHRGVCLQFRTDSDDSPFGLARRVIYQKARPAIPVPLEAQHHDQVADLVGLTKADWWSYEKEYRLFLAHGEPPPAIKLVGGGRVGSFDARHLIGITLGLRIADGDREELTAMARAHKPPLEVHQACEDEKEFSLRIDRIE